MGHVRYGDEEKPRSTVDFSAADLRGLACGPTSAGAVDEIGYAFSWGKDGSRNLYISLPEVLDYFVTYKIHINQMALGAFHGVAISKQGDLFTWGHGDVGQLGSTKVVFPTNTRFLSTPIKLDPDDYMDPSAYGTTDVQAAHKDFRSVCAGANYSMALTARGNIYTWGSGPNGELGLGSKSVSGTPQQVFIPVPVCSIACGDDHATVVTKEGHMYVWGGNSAGQLGLGDKVNRREPVKMTSFANQVCEVTAGVKTTAAVAKNNSLFAWGLGSPEQIIPLIQPFGQFANDRIMQVAAGANHFVALTENHHVFTWGSNGKSQLGNGAFLDDGTPIDFVAQPAIVTALEDKLVKQICAGRDFTAALAAAPKVSFCPCMQDTWRKNAEAGWDSKPLATPAPEEMTPDMEKAYKEQMVRFNKYMDSYTTHANDQSRDLCLNPCAGLVCEEGAITEVKKPCSCQCVKEVVVNKPSGVTKLDGSIGGPGKETEDGIARAISAPKLKDGSKYVPPMIAPESSTELSGEDINSGDLEEEGYEERVEFDSARDGVDMGHGWGVPGGLKKPKEVGPPIGSMKKQRDMDWWPAEEPTKIADPTEVVVQPAEEGDGMDAGTTHLSALPVASTTLNLAAKPWDGVNFKPWEAKVVAYVNHTLPASAWAMLSHMPEPPTPAEIANVTSRSSLLPISQGATPTRHLMPELPLTKSMPAGNHTRSSLKITQPENMPAPGHPYFHNPNSPMPVDSSLTSGGYDGGNNAVEGRTGTYDNRFNTRNVEDIEGVPPMRLKLGCQGKPGGCTSAELALSNLLVTGGSSGDVPDKKWLLEEAMEQGVDVTPKAKTTLRATALSNTIPSDW